MHQYQIEIPAKRNAIPDGMAPDWLVRIR